MQIIKRNTVLCVFGMKGSGKSFLVKDIVLDYPRVIAIDNIGEYNLEIVQGREQSIRRIVQASREESYRLAIRTNSVEEDLQIIKLVGTLANMLLVVEETSKYVTSNYMPEPIEALIRYGRHRAISQIYMARRPSEISRELTANADGIIVFRTQEPRDVAYMRTFIGDRADKLGTLPEYVPSFHGYANLEKMPLSVIERV